MIIRKNIKLAEYTTFHIGGRAKYFVEVKSVQDLKEAVDFAHGKKLKIFVLGGGSNLLLPDKDINGLVLKIAMREIRFQDKGDHTLVSAGAGDSWDNVVAKTVRKGLGGIENLSLIPGTVGGAVYQNIGAYGAELKDILESVQVFDTKTNTIKTLSNNDCRFGYRDSVFQHQEGSQYLILEMTIKLSRGAIPNITYHDLIKYFEGKKDINIQEIRKAVVQIRKSKLVYPTINIGTAGSFFKNPIITSADFQKLISDYPDIKGRDIGDGLVKLSAGQLIEKSRWKGKRLENVSVSERHALVLMSHKGAKAKDVLALAKKIQKDVRVKFGVLLEPEVKIVV